MEKVHTITLDHIGPFYCRSDPEPRPKLRHLLNVPRSGRLRFIVTAGAFPELLDHSLTLCCNYPPKSNFEFEREKFYEYKSM